MSYQVLARKWRPRNFSELVGQPHVQRALVNALEEERLHHAYLFTGTRGVGKTTIARIFAKCLNCETGVTATPCGVCESCRAIDEGRFVDLIEVDAASRTKVEDTRELLDNVQYAPTRGRYKVYLIDEVHMLSGHSFNALLKTLEEPPPHVKFLLATTDPQKLPVTVLSRCLQFNLKRMSSQMIVDHLQHILDEEGLAYDTSALSLLAKAADGSMRDALSLLDQAIAYAGGKVGDAEAREMLGSISQEHIYILIEALIRPDAAGIMSEISRLAEQAPDFQDVLSEFITILHHLALIQKVPDALDLSEEELQRLQGLAAAVHAEDLQLYYQIALQGRRDLPVAPDMHDAFEMVMLRMLAFTPDEQGDVETAVQAAPGTTSVSGQSKTASRTEKRNEGVNSTASAPVQKKASAAESGQAVAGHDLSELDDWCALVPNLGLSAMVRELANNCRGMGLENDVVVLGLAKPKSHLATDNARSKLADSLSLYFDQTLSLRIEITEDEGETPAQNRQRAAEDRQRQAEKTVQEDSFIKALEETFDAEIVPGTVKPN
jgi:DNA polymerase III subunit gamma/tau